MPEPTAESYPAYQDFLSLLEEVRATGISDVYRSLVKVPDLARREIEGLIQAVPVVASLSLAQRLAICIAFDLGIRDINVLGQINKTAALGIIHSFWLDQIIDSRGEAPGAPLRNVYLTHLVFGLYVDSWLALVDGSVAYKEFLAIEIETYSALFEEEVFHVGASQKFGSQDIIAHKCSPVKSIAVAILALTGRSELNALIIKVIENISLALCTLDDLLDWEEDYERGRITFPIQLALDRLHCVYKVEKHEELKALIFREIFFGRIYHELMHEITKGLEESRLLALTFSPRLSSFIDDCRSKTLASWQAYVRLLISYPNQEICNSVAR